MGKSNLSRRGFLKGAGISAAAIVETGAVPLAKAEPPSGIRRPGTGGRDAVSAWLSSIHSAYHGGVLKKTREHRLKKIRRRMMVLPEEWQREAA